MAISLPWLKHSYSFVHSFLSFSCVKREYDKVSALRELPVQVESCIPSKYVSHNVIGAIMAFCGIDLNSNFAAL